MDEKLKKLAEAVNTELRSRGFTLATAESCTGGMLAAAITSIPGSSDVFNGGVVAYSNEVKRNVLGVSGRVLALYGAVSEQTVRYMAEGVARVMRSDCAIATSGVAGPGGGTDEKPVGTVWIAVAVAGDVKTALLQLEDGGREANICLSAEKVLSLLLETLSQK